MDITNTKVTPRDTIEALRLMRREGLVQPDDDDATKEALQGVVALYLSGKRAGDIDTGFADWYENADLTDLLEDAGPDPTA